jgi:subtilisin family serine protease
MCRNAFRLSGLLGILVFLVLPAKHSGLLGVAQAHDAPTFACLLERHPGAGFAEFLGPQGIFRYTVDGFVLLEFSSSSHASPNEAKIVELILRATPSNPDAQKSGELVFALNSQAPSQGRLKRDGKISFVLDVSLQKFQSFIPETLSADLEGAVKGEVLIAVLRGEIPEGVPVLGQTTFVLPIYCARHDLIYGTVFYDTNGDGSQETGWVAGAARTVEAGLGQISVELRSADGLLLQSAKTDHWGNYVFGIKPGAYSVSIVVPRGLEPTVPSHTLVDTTKAKGPETDFGLKDPQDKDYLHGQAVLLFDESGDFTDARIHALVAKYRLTCDTKFEKLLAYVCRAPEDQLFSTLRALRSESDLIAELNLILESLDHVRSSDPLWPQQWGAQRIGLPQAWHVTTGSSEIRVAVIDGGVDFNHPDLSSNYVPGGLNWITRAGPPMDDFGHGTHVAGIIAAVLNNNQGIAGVAPTVRFLAEKVLGPTGSGPVDTIALGIDSAVNRGARILNMSLGAPVGTNLLQRAVSSAFTRGILMVAATGNETRGGVCSPVRYPAAYPEVIAVGATAREDRRAFFSNCGPEVELAAPGMEIVSTGGTPGCAPVAPGYRNCTGTSQATPLVAGAAALVWSANPQLSRDRVREILQTTAVDLGPRGRDIEFGYGLVNANRAVEASQVSPGDIDVAPGTLNFGRLRLFQCRQQSATVTNRGGSALVVRNITISQPRNRYALLAPRSFPFSLLPGQSQNITVQACRVSGRRVVGTLSIFSDDPDEPVASVTLISTRR